jgi:hypothetical protein
VCKVIFGIGTQTNNSLTLNNYTATVYPTDSNGNFITTYKNTTQMTGSYIDSGSNALFFNDGIAMCSWTTWAYCPQLPLTSLNATNASWTGNPTGTVNFSIVAVDPLAPSIVAANIGGPYGGSNPQFGWGLPFFYGRSVYTAISGVTPPQGVPVGPFWAY